MSTIIKANGRTFAAAAVAPGDPAYREAAEIIEAAHAEAARIRLETAEGGRREGLAAAAEQIRLEAAASVATLVPALRQVIDDIAAARQQWRAHWEREAIHLAAAMARRVIRRELQHQPEITLVLVAEALEMSAGKPHVRILLHPEDHRALGDQVRQLVQEIGRLADAEILADESLTRGGCRLESRHGTIDQTIEAQLDRIERELT